MFWNWIFSLFHTLSERIYSPQFSYDQILSLFHELFGLIEAELFSDLQGFFFFIPNIILTYSKHYSDQYISNYFLKEWDQIFSLFHTLFRPIYFQFFSDGLRSNLLIIQHIIQTNILPIIFWLTEIKTFHYSTHYSNQYISNNFQMDWDKIFSLFHSLFRPIYFQLFSDGLRSNLFIIPNIIQTNIFPIIFWWTEIKYFHYSTHYSDQYISNYFLTDCDEIFSFFHT